MRAAATLAALAGGLVLATPGGATTFSNAWGSSADFPAGAASFADALVEFSPGIVPEPGADRDIPLPEYRDGNNVLGPPDMNVEQVIECSNAPSTETCKFVSLGVGGTLTVRFTDNLLTGSGNADPDLYIFETGPAEGTFVDVSADGVNWFSVGLWPTFADGIDIDAFGFGIDDRFGYVRLRDDPDQGNTTGLTVGGDIDAIGAISTVVIPLPASAWLLASAIGLLGAARRMRRA